MAERKSFSIGGGCGEECQHPQLERHYYHGMTWWQCAKGCDFALRPPGERTFCIGVDPGVNERRKEAEDKLAPCFELRDRVGVNKILLYGRLWVEIADAPLPLVRRAMAVLRGERA